MMAAKDFSAALPLSCASLLDWISNMSLTAACFTKSSVAGLMPSVELTPVFSPMDWAIAGAARRTSARHEARCFILSSFLKRELLVSIGDAQLRSSHAKALPPKASAMAFRSRGAGRFGVNTLSKCDRIELGVGRLFLVEVGRQEADHFVVAKLLSPCDQRAVPA